MDIFNSLKAECIQYEAELNNKEAILREIAKLAKKSPVLKDITEDHLFGALQEREKISSTGFENGLAIPHCRLKEVSEFVVGLLVLPNGVDFGAYDGQPSNIIFFIIAPDSDCDVHIRLLSTISRTMNNTAVRDEILSKTNPVDIQEAFLRHVHDEIPKTTDRKCIFHIAMQNEEKLNEILQALSALSAQVSILESNNIGAYLHRLPLFASFWNSEEKGFHLLILGTVSKKLANELIRNIDNIVGGLAKNPGTMVTVQDVLISSGSLT